MPAAQIISHKYLHLLLSQNLILKIQSYNHSFLTSPPISLTNPTWSYSYTFLASAKQILKFHLYSLNRNNYIQQIASGKFDFRDYIARYNPGQYFTVKMILDSFYNNEVILHMRMRYKDEVRSRNDGLKQISRPSGINYLNYQPMQPNKTKQKSFFANWFGQNSEPHAHQNKDVLFKGPCATRNFFSFLDPIYKGQSYNFIEPSKK